MAERLRSIAEGHGLGWVVDQVDEVAREGKPLFKRPPGQLVRDVDEFVPAAVTRERGILETEPYSAQERAQLLAAALGRVITHIAAAEVASAELLLDSDFVESVVFVDEFEEEPPRWLDAERVKSDQHMADQGRLREALRELGERVGS